MSEKDLFGQIEYSVKSGKAPVSFRAKDFPFLKESPSFISKHCEGNPGGYSAMFTRAGRGLYKLAN